MALVNNAQIAATIDSVALTANSEVTVELSDLWFEKTVSDDIWTEGELTYTLYIENQDLEDSGLPMEITTLIDPIDPTIATLSEGSVMINGVLAVVNVDYTFNATTGQLEFINLDPVASKGSTTITFRVKRI